jgi:hypothetical protein
MFKATDLTPAYQFNVGARVELHPGTDAWMRGDRYGTVKGYGRQARPYADSYGAVEEIKPVLVVLDKSGQQVRCHPASLTLIL